MPLKYPLRPVVLGILALITLENGFFVLVVIMYRNKLKHNIIYRYVSSGLFANIAYCLSIFYHNLNQYVGFQKNDAVYLWAFEQGMLYFIKC